MIKRIVEISNPSYVHLRYKQMVVERDGKEVGTVPVEDLGVLIIDDPQVSISHSLLRECWQNNVVVLFSDEKHLPGSILLPMAGNTLHAKILNQQVEASLPLKKQLWQQIIGAKIRNQGIALLQLGKDPGSIPHIAKQVKSGDPENLEGQAARIYWPILFGDPFKRDRTRDGVNAMLNYGYAVLRGAVARSVVASGLHPALGIHHHNQYDYLCLADDLIEPLRPCVDKIIYRMILSGNYPLEVSKQTKPQLLTILSVTCGMKGRNLPLLAALQQYTATVRDVLIKKRKKAICPEIITEEMKE